MARERREIWVKRVAAWRESGLELPAYAARAGVGEERLKRWGWKLAREKRAQRKRGETTPDVGIDFVELAGVAAPAPTMERFEVVLPCGLTVRVPPEFDANELGRLIAAIERR